MPIEIDPVFRALADPTRRHLLDRLHEDNGQTLRGLCAQAAMTRQAVTQHLGVLEAANLVTTVRRGREKLHYLNPVPLQEIQERWIDKFEPPRLRALSNVKRRAENAMTDKPSYVYVTYIEATSEAVWQALTDADLTGAYWGHRNVSDWKVGSTWVHERLDGSGNDGGGIIEVADAPYRLVMSWGGLDEQPEEAPSRVTFAIEPYGAIVRLTVTHEDLANEIMRDAVGGGWPAVMANLKSLLETGHVLPETPWEMPVG